MIGRVARVLHGTVAEGPGRRTAVWFQGCSIRCRGCINPHLFRSDGGEDLAAASVVAGAVASGDEGLTLIGGEPFDQPEFAAELAASAQRVGLGVICFTGNLIEDLRSRGGAAPDVIGATDLLIDGPFDASLPERDRPLVGSQNQRLIHLTDRYRAAMDGLARNRVELRITADGTIDVAGFADRDRKRRLAETLGGRRKRLGS